MRLLVGTSGSFDAERDLASLDLVELRVGRGRIPSLKAAQRWRHAVPDSLSVLLRADIDLREPLGGNHVSRTWKATIELARALDAALVIVPTSSSMRPTDDHRGIIERFFAWAHCSGVRLGWEPRCDAWPDDVLAEVCREHTLTHVVDPMHRRPARGRPPCFRIRGQQGGYTGEELSRIRERIEAHGDGHTMYDTDRAYVIFGNASRRDDARRLRELAAPES